MKENKTKEADDPKKKSKAKERTAHCTLGLAFLIISRAELASRLREYMR